MIGFGCIGAHLLSFMVCHGLLKMIFQMGYVNVRACVHGCVYVHTQFLYEYVRACAMILSVHAHTQCNTIPDVMLYNTI